MYDDRLEGWLRWADIVSGGQVHIEFADDLVLAFCERRIGQTYPWDPALRRPLIMRIQSLEAALTEHDVRSLAVMNYKAIDTAQCTIQVAEAYRLRLKFSRGTPPMVSIQGLDREPTGDRSV